MLGSSDLPKGPLYDPKSKIKNFEIDKDFENITLIASREKILYEDPRPLDDLGPMIEWKRPKEICDKPYFINGKPSRFDALQGHLNDCWLIVGIEALTLHEQLIKHVVPPDQSFDDNYTGAFHFRFWQLGVWYDVVVDDRLPVNKISKQLAFCHSKSGNVFWAALIEKAYCKICGSRTTKYKDLAVGYINTAFQDLTGGILEVVVLQDPPPGRPLTWFLNEVHLKRAFLGSFVSSPNPDPWMGLITEHSYLISKIFYCQNENSNYYGLFLVRIMNPWGKHEWLGGWNDHDIGMWGKMNREIRQEMNFKVEEDGEFWMSETDFVKFFKRMHTCHLGPGQYHYSHNANTVPTWGTTTFRGEWVRGVNCGGPHRHKRHKNPQYKIVFKSPENDTNKDGRTTAVINLTQRSLMRRIFSTRVGFYIYKLTDLKDQNPEYRLKKDFFDNPNNIPEYNMDLSKSEGRAHTTAVYLTPGCYCIIPCTEKESDATSFLLRVFAESEVEHWEYDIRISKSSPVNEGPNDNFIDEELKRFFDEAAQNEEIDWIGLKDILRKGMNRNSLQGTLALFFNRSLGGVMANPSKGHDNAYIVFSKDECRSIIAMVDRDYSGKIDYNKFYWLWKKILFLCHVYDTFRDCEGYLKVNKLREALSSLGVNLNKQVIHSLIHFYSNENDQIILTDFIVCGVILETFFTRYEKDEIKKGRSFTLEEWVIHTLTV